MLYNDLDKGKKNWLLNVKRLLESYGFYHVWLNPTAISNPKEFCRIFKRRLIDCFMQVWRENVDICCPLLSYRYFKNTFEFEYY